MGVKAEMVLFLSHWTSFHDTLKKLVVVRKVRKLAVSWPNLLQMCTSFQLHVHFNMNKFKYVSTAAKKNRIFFPSNFTVSCFRVSVLLNVTNIKAYCRGHFIFIPWRTEISYLVKKHSVLKFCLSAFKTTRVRHNFPVTLQHLRLNFHGFPAMYIMKF